MYILEITFTFDTQVYLEPNIFIQVVFYWVTNFYLNNFLLRYLYLYLCITIEYFFHHW
jgi:hypothetical protein